MATADFVAVRPSHQFSAASPSRCGTETAPQAGQTRMTLTVSPFGSTTGAGGGGWSADGWPAGRRVGIRALFET